jgi:hypothetical protein
MKYKYNPVENYEHYIICTFFLYIYIIKILLLQRLYQHLILF